MTARARSGFVASAILVLTVGCLTGYAVADVNLEWRPASQVVGLNDIVELGLYAVSDNEVNQSMAAMEVIIGWDPEYLTLLGTDNNGPYTWLSSGFPSNNIDGINDTWEDGDALYNALSQFGNPAYATPDGLLVTTVRFEAIQLTSEPVVVEMIAELGNFTNTVVWDGDVPNHDITGTIGTATVQVGCGGPDLGDMNCDGLVNNFDIDPFVLALTDPVGYEAAYPSCNIDNGDINCDGLVNNFDIDPFVALLTGG